MFKKHVSPSVVVVFNLVQHHFGEVFALVVYKWGCTTRDFVVATRGYDMSPRLQAL